MKNRMALVAAALTAILMACQVPESPKPHMGKVTLHLNASQGMTILPVVSVSSYVITFQGPASIAPISTGQSNPTIELPVGTWDIDVQGKDSGGVVVAVGGVNGVVVTAGATTPVSIVLTAQSSGTGAIDVTVTWPATVSPAIDGYDVTLDGVAVPGAAVTFSAVSRSVQYVEPKAAGSYALVITLKTGGMSRASVVEAVQVYGNLTSSATIALQDADFTLAPAAPTGLAVIEGLAKINLSWVDNSRVETGYVVERRTGGSLDWSYTLAANTTSYSDTTAVAGQTHVYSVGATNGIGTNYAGDAGGMWQAPAVGGAGALTVGTVTSDSVALSWQKATDNASAQTALSYRVVRSLSDDIGNVADALANGTVVLDWTLDTASVNATGLSASTLYYFNVLVRDAAGNTSVYVPTSATTHVLEGSVSITITATSPQNETITFNESDDIVVAPDAVLSITIGETFDSYAWLLDGAVLSGQTSATVSINCSLLAPGVHHVTVFVHKNGLMYSKTLRFRIEN
jgi:hypothetical protein